MSKSFMCSIILTLMCAVEIQAGEISGDRQPPANLRSTFQIAGIGPVPASVDLERRGSQIEGIGPVPGRINLGGVEGTSAPPTSVGVAVPASPVVGIFSVFEWLLALLGLI